MSALDEVIQSLEPGDLVELYQLDATSLGGPVYYFTSSANGTEPIVYDGETYTPIDLEAEGFEWSGQGSMPTPTIRISNANRVVGAAVNEFQDLVGAYFVRIKTFRQFLDGEDDENPEAVFPIDVFRVERKSRKNKVLVEWELSSPMDQQGRQIPARQYTRDSCSWIYRSWNPDTLSFDYSRATCPWAGDTYYDARGNVVSDPSKDRCSKQLTSGCRRRFGANAELPFGGFPGVGQNF